MNNNRLQVTKGQCFEFVKISASTNAGFNYIQVEWDSALAPLNRNVRHLDTNKGSGMKLWIILLFMIPMHNGGVSADLFHHSNADPFFSLYRSVFFSNIPSYSATNLEVSDYPEELQARIKDYIHRTREFHSLMESPRIDSSRVENFSLGDTSFGRRRAIEQAIVALISAEGIEEIAVDCAKVAKLYSEWEGFSDALLTEARYFECAIFEKKLEVQDLASRKYQEYFKEVSDFKDPLMKSIAEVIHESSFLYIETEQHP